MDSSQQFKCFYPIMGTEVRYKSYLHLCYLFYFQFQDRSVRSINLDRIIVERSTSTVLTRFANRLVEELPVPFFQNAELPENPSDGPSSFECSLPLVSPLLAA